MNKFAFVLLFVCLSIATAQKLSVTVRVLDETSVPAHIIASAEKKVNYLLGEAGLDLNWIDCERQKEACSATPQPDDVAFIIRVHSRRELEKKFEVAGIALLGSSHTGSCAILYYDQVLRSEQTANMVSKGALLGSIMAHEFGHLMGLEHQNGGLMRADWETRELFDLGMLRMHFSASERQRIQTEVADRLRSKLESPIYLARVNPHGR